jgi:hypothetical protein
MPFAALKLKPSSGAKQIKSADDAYSFMIHMRLSFGISRLAGGDAGAEQCRRIR